MEEVYGQWVSRNGSAIYHFHVFKDNTYRFAHWKPEDRNSAISTVSPFYKFEKQVTFYLKLIY